MKCLTASNKTSFMNSQNMSPHNTFLTQKVIFGVLNGQLAAQGMNRRDTHTNLDSQHLFLTSIVFTGFLNICLTETNRIFIF